MGCRTKEQANKRRFLSSLLNSEDDILRSPDRAEVGSFYQQRMTRLDFVLMTDCQGCSERYASEHLPCQVTRPEASRLEHSNFEAFCHEMQDKDACSTLAWSSV